MKVSTPFVSRTLTIVGFVLIAAALLDYFILFLPPELDNRQWQINFVSQMVDRGIVPLVGMAFVMVGSWLGGEGRSALPVNPRFATLILASVLGVLFLVMVPLHISNVQTEKGNAVKRIQEQASQAEGNLTNAIASQIEQERGRIQALLQNDKVLNQAIAQGQIKGDQVALLDQFKKNPGEVDKYLNDTAKKEEERLRKEISDRQGKAETEANQTALKAGMRTGLSSALLAVGFALIGWSGLRELRP